MRPRSSAGLASILFVLAFAAPAAGYPTHDTGYYPIYMARGSDLGWCDVFVDATATNTAFGVVGTISGRQDATCAPPAGLENYGFFTQTKIFAVGTASGATGTLSTPYGPTSNCSLRGTCSSFHQRALESKGDFRVVHRLHLDITPGESGSGTYYYDYPRPECIVRPADRGDITCEVELYVTL